MCGDIIICGYRFSNLVIIGFLILLKVLNKYVFLLLKILIVVLVSLLFLIVFKIVFLF